MLNLAKQCVFLGKQPLDFFTLRLAMRAHLYQGGKTERRLSLIIDNDVGIGIDHYDVASWTFEAKSTNAIFRIDNSFPQFERALAFPCAVEHAPRLTLYLSGSLAG